MTLLCQIIGIYLFFVALLALIEATDTNSCNLVLNSPSSPTSSTQDANNSQLTPQEQVLRSIPAQCSFLKDTAPRGLACLHCLQPEARDQAEAIIQLLQESCLKNVAVNYLIDGSFSYDENLLKRHIDLLSTDGRHLTLILYFANGPSQRKFPGPRLNGFGTDMTPEDFRERITEDRTLQQEYIKLVKRTVPALQYASERGATLMLIPMLEDNLDARSFIALSRLLENSIPDGVSYRIGRNPCARCSVGADAFLPDGFFREEHNIAAASRINHGVITNDGDTSELEQYLQKSRFDVSLTALQQAVAKSETHHNVFILWSAARQGLYTNNSGAMARKSAADRNYALFSQEEYQQILRLLQNQ